MSAMTVAALVLAVLALAVGVGSALAVSRAARELRRASAALESFEGEVRAALVVSASAASRGAQAATPAPALAALEAPGPVTRRRRLAGRARDKLLSVAFGTPLVKVAALPAGTSYALRRLRARGRR
ncbi:MAG: hypothetical protein ACRDYD_03170 [Acidimicrobiales bacterium]